MAEKRCGLGLSCASMMQQTELRVEECPNLSVCGVAYRLEPTTEFELIRGGQAPVRVTRQRAAAMMLMNRGCAQAVARERVLVQQADEPAGYLRAR